MKKIKILTISTSGLVRKDGISTVIFDNFNRFNKEKFDLHIIASGAYSYELIQEFEKIGVSIKCLPSREVNVIKYIEGFRKLFKTEQYDILYIHGSSAIMTIELSIAKLCGCKVRIVHSHNTICSHKKLDRFLRPFFYNLYTGALACGQDAGKWLFGNRPFNIVKNGRNVELYRFDKNKRSIMRHELDVSNSTLLIGHVGNFNKQKNQEFLIYTFKDMLKLYPDSKLYLMGAGKTLDSMKRLAEQLSLSKNIVFTGTISNVPDMLQAMDVMVLPSLHEGLPLVVVEWQIAALPCLISDTVTKECAYTDLVYFKSLESGYESWAKKIIEISNYDRIRNSDKVVELTCKNGFDINENVIKLQKYFQEKCELENDK